MSISLDRAGSRQKAGLGRMLLSPQALLTQAGVLVCLLLAVPLSAPIGPMYWDVMIYYDAANRIFDGQAPVLDFFTPVGPLGYYIFAGWLTLFPDAQPTLIAHWSLLVLTAPLMALVVWQIDQRSRVTALALLVPFLIFALLPFNTREFYPYPGSDGFGIYNRQACQVLYILVAALVFVRKRRLLTGIIIATMTALFFLKITGFVAAISASQASMSGWRGPSASKSCGDATSIPCAARKRIAESIDTYVSRHPCLPQMHGCPAGTAVVWPNSPALPLVPPNAAPWIITPLPRPMPT